MDNCTELHHLQQRSKELQTIAANLEDIRDWMVKNQGQMRSGLLECVTRLDAAITEVKDVQGMIADKATEVEDEVYAEATQGSA